MPERNHRRPRSGTSGRGAVPRSAQKLHTQALGSLGVEGHHLGLAIGRKADDQAVVQIDPALGIAL